MTPRGKVGWYLKVHQYKTSQDLNFETGSDRSFVLTKTMLRLLYTFN